MLQNVTQDRALPSGICSKPRLVGHTLYGWERVFQKEHVYFSLCPLGSSLSCLPKQKPLILAMEKEARIGELYGIL